MKNLICRIWIGKTKRYGATFISCKKHFEMTKKSLQTNFYDGGIESIGHSHIECEECKYRKHGKNKEE